MLCTEYKFQTESSRWDAAVSHENDIWYMWLECVCARANLISVYGENLFDFKWAQPHTHTTSSISTLLYTSDFWYVTTDKGK